MAQKKTNLTNGLIVATGNLFEIPITACAFEFNFIGGSMGVAVGTCFVEAVQYAVQHKQALICFINSGGARMQEGLMSLMQMARTSAALHFLTKNKLPFITVLANPTFGGVSASIAMLGDIIIAEPKSLIGFAGPRVIEQTVREVLPEGFQRSEFLLKHGAIDMIVARNQLKTKIYSIIKKLYKY